MMQKLLTTCKRKERNLIVKTIIENLDKLKEETYGNNKKGKIFKNKKYNINKINMNMFIYKWAYKKWTHLYALTIFLKN